jgi:hypothetical protein
LECVSGRRYWGKHKCHELISKAIEKGGRGKVVTKSDEAFALLLFDNYVYERTNPKATTNQNDTADADDQESRKQPRQRGGTQQKRAGTANIEGVVARERYGSINSTNLYRRAGNALMQRQWKRN